MSRTKSLLTTSTAVAASLVVALVGCGDDETSSSSGGGGAGGDAQGGGSPTTSSTTASTTSSSSSAGGGGGGGAPPSACAETAPRATNGSVIAVSPDDTRVVVANRDVGTVTIFSATYAGGLPTLTEVAELAVGAEPWQVAIDGCSDRAYVITRRDQELVVIDGLSGTPSVTAEIAVGSEPTGIALSPNNTRVYVANWVDGTVTVVNGATLAVDDTVDLNPVLADTGLLGASVTEATARPALAHPRSLAVTNDGDADDADETVVVTEFFGQRNAPEAADGSNVDINWVGLLYTIDAGTLDTDTISLASIADVDFTGAETTGCFANQLQGLTIEGENAYVTSICASPKGPTNPKQMTHPALSVVDLSTGDELDDSPAMLDGAMVGFYETNTFADDRTRRVPLLANDVAFDPATGDAYVAARGVDAVFRFEIDETTGAVTESGSGAAKPFFDLSSAALDEAFRGMNPLGLATAHAQPFAFVANDITRNVTALAIAAAEQEVAGASDDDPRVFPSTDLPTNAGDQAALRGRRAFDTGLDRFSLSGQGWGACASCHFEGLSDNITWYFARGPRQSTSMEGSFASDDPTDQRIFNWTAVADEMADFEGVLRSLDGGVGAIVHTISDPPVNGDRIDLAAVTATQTFGAAGLNGSARARMMEADSDLLTWDDVEIYAQRIRSPRAPSNLDATAVAAGAALFAGDGGCAGCHGGAKWTLSTLFYDPSPATNEALKTTAYDGDQLVTDGFPAALLPAPDASQFMRSGSGPGDVLQCALRPVGTYEVSPAGVNAIEVRQDMSTAALGDEAVGKGYNVPSLLGMQVGAPYFHAGNARTLEELLDAMFAAHHGALAEDGFLTGGTAAADRAAIVQYLLSIDEGTTTVALPADPGADGGDFCAAP